MLVAVEWLRGTRCIQVPRCMMKFEDPNDFGPELGAICFSKVRPASLSLDAIIRFEARGVDRAVFVKAQETQLRRIGGALTRRRIDRILRIDEGDQDADGSRGGAFIDTFARMLMSGFDPQQHPLLQVISEQQRKGFERAKRSLHMPGIWSLRVHPEPMPPDGSLPVLEGRQVFALVPNREEDSPDDLSALTGPGVINYSADRDPAALIKVEGIDSPILRERCKPGCLYFSIRGRPVQEGSPIDFDGDYVQYAVNPDLVNIGEGEASAVDPYLAKTPLRLPSESPSLPDEMLDFITEFSEEDCMGLWHYRWQMLAGEGPQAANSLEARRAAKTYSASLDVEKGGPRCLAPPKEEFLPKWDFMKNPGPEPRKSQTAAGEIARMADRALVNFNARLRSLSRTADQDLLEEWRSVSARLGKEKEQKLVALADGIRGELIHHIKGEIQRSDADKADLNFDSQSFCDEKDQLHQEWLEQARSTAQAKVAELSASLTDLALAAWHLKYVRQGSAKKAEDPDVSFPWILFCEELCDVKVKAKPCCQWAMQRYRRLLLRAQRAAEACRGGVSPEAAQQDFSKAIRDLRGAKVSCDRCQSYLTKQRKALEFCETEPTANNFLDAFQKWAKGEVRSLPCSELFYAKAAIGHTFRHGKEQDTPLEGLKRKLVGKDGAQVLKGLKELTAIEYHDRLYVVEGNRRLWALKEAERHLNKELVVRVRIVDLYVGYVRQQEQRSPALVTFWEKFTTQNSGTSVAWEKDVEIASRSMFSQLDIPNKALKGMATVAVCATIRCTLSSELVPGSGLFMFLLSIIMSVIIARIRPRLSGTMEQEQRPNARRMLPAKYEALCKRCHGQIRKGDMIVNLTEGWCHANCGAGQPLLREPASQPQPRPSLGGVPASTADRCPECGKKMKSRTNGSTGEKFWGCEGFFSSPKCKYTRPM